MHLSKISGQERRKQLGRIREQIAIDPQVGLE
jgi:hypothetical protein